MKTLLEKLHLTSVNYGVGSGPDDWIASAADPITSYNPTTGAAIAQVLPADAAAYDAVVAHAQTAFRTWRNVPAPKRGEVIR
ncbi:MAG TPA: aldehyde dehydrogenase family protein, partial [Chloroflexi bacterium]|nr:aldehyde dehydrogenase family protein [Chloroflexota bacterium]